MIALYRVIVNCEGSIEAFNYCDLDEQDAEDRFATAVNHPSTVWVKLELVSSRGVRFTARKVERRC